MTKTESSKNKMKLIGTIIFTFHLILIFLSIQILAFTATTTKTILHNIRSIRNLSGSDSSDDDVHNNEIKSQRNIRNSQTLAFEGAGIPRPDLNPEDIPPLLMKALELNDFPKIDSGLQSVWAFSGDITRHIFSQNRTEFIESAHQTANTMPTSFYGAAMYGINWTMETPINRVGGDNGWIATQVMKTYSSDGRMRRWQWEIRRNRRPPNLNCWFVESIGSSDRKGDFDVALH